MKTMYHPLPRHIFLILALISRSIILSAQEDPPSQSEQTEDIPVESTENTQSIHEKWESTLRFGIESAVISTIDEMIELRDESFAPQVADLLKSNRESIRLKTLQYFESLELDTAIPLILDELRFYQDLPRTSLIRYIEHLERRERPIDAELWELLEEMLEEEEQNVQLSVARYIGRVRYEDAADALQGLYEADDSSLGLRESILRALGAIGSPRSRDTIFELADDDTIENTLRIAAIEAAASYADDDALELIGKSFSSPDPLIRTAAVSGLRHFNRNEAQDLLAEALRDSFWRIRQSALRIIAEEPNPVHDEAVVYMAENDPEAPVKQQAYRTLAAIGSEDSISFLQESLEKETSLLPYRQLSAALLIEHDFTGSKNVIEGIMASEWEKENSRLLDTICRELSTRDLPGASDLFERMLSHANYIIQIYGVRGIGRNSLSQYRQQLEEILENGSAHPALKSNARTSLDQI